MVDKTLKILLYSPEYCPNCGKYKRFKKLKMKTVDIRDAIKDVENEYLEEDIHKRVYCLADMRVYANKVIDKLKEKNNGNKLGNR